MTTKLTENQVRWIIEKHLEGIGPADIHFALINSGCWISYGSVRNICKARTHGETWQQILSEKAVEEVA